MLDKFYLQSIILESHNFNLAVKDGNYNPFSQDKIVICSYNFARNKADFIKQNHWDLVCCDESHRLRNVYKKANKIAAAIKDAINPFKKILLTATPLQNSLLELYGLVSIIDDQLFGDLKSYRSQYTKIADGGIYSELKRRLAPICKRTLRKQVIEYVRYTKRIPITQKFIPSTDEQQLYEMVSDYLQRPNLQALPAQQRTLMTLVLRKLLASSTFAIAGALYSLSTKLEKKLHEIESNSNNRSFDDIPNEVIEDYESFNEESEEWEDEDGNTYSQGDIKAIKAEIEDLKAFRDLAISITENAKGEKLLTALTKGFEKITELGGEKKAVIFTESRKTQNYILRILSDNPEYSGRILLFNGSNNDDKSKQIYKDWLIKYEHTDKISGVRSADMRAALVEYFESEAIIMIATEAAAEGINLQFCSLVVNYDLPWNPQRIEQRIGRCHRYGQQFDVVVVNFLNTKNQADIRVFQLLTEKFKLFEGVFGASDEVLGVIESGVDFEKRILQIYQRCRTLFEIQSAFDDLQNEFETEISDAMLKTRKKLLENFDEEVHEKLISAKELSEHFLSMHQKRLLEISHLYLNDYCVFEDGGFHLKRTVPGIDISFGRYTFSNDEKQGHRFRINHPLATWVLEQAKQTRLPSQHLRFIYTGIPKITILDDLIGKKGALLVKSITIESFEKEDITIISAITTDLQKLEEDQAQRLFSLQGEIISVNDDSITFSAAEDHYLILKKKILEKTSERNNQFFDDEIDKLECWADDIKKSLEIEIKDLDIEIKTRKSEARKLQNLDQKVEAQREIKRLEESRKEKRKSLFDAQDEIDKKKESVIDEIQLRLQQNVTEEELFRITWEVVRDE